MRLNEGSTHHEKLWEKLKKGEVVQRSKKQEKKLKDFKASKFRLLHVTTTQDFFVCLTALIKKSDEKKSCTVVPQITPFPHRPTKVDD